MIKACFIDHGRSIYFSATLPTEAVPPLFEDVSDKAGLGSAGVGGSLKGDAVLVADVNGDGRPDILFCAGNGLLLLNTSRGFVEAKESGISFHPGKVSPIFADFFGDKRMHLLIPQHDGVKLIRNDGAGRFTDVTAKSGDLATLNCDASSAAVGDFTGKGRTDILIGCIKGTNHMLRNNGDGTFTDVTENVGLDQRVFNTRATAVVDFNRDGAPDAVFLNEGQESVLLLGRLRPPAARAEPTDDSPVPALAGLLPTSATGPASPPYAMLGIAGVVLIFAAMSVLFPKKSHRLFKMYAIVLGLGARAQMPVPIGQRAEAMPPTPASMIICPARAIRKFAGSTGRRSIFSPRRCLPAGRCTFRGLAPSTRRRFTPWRWTARLQIGPCGRVARRSSRCRSSPRRRRRMDCSSSAMECTRLTAPRFTACMPKLAVHCGSMISLEN